MERTLDPTTWIVARGTNVYGEPLIEYENTDGDRWLIWGTCTQCGLCEVGGQTERTATLVWTGEPGTPGACHDPAYGARLDLPVRPELGATFAECSLSGRYVRRGGD